MEQFIFTVAMVPQDIRDYISKATDKNGKLSSIKLRYMPENYRKWFEDNKNVMTPRTLFNLLKNNLMSIPFCEYCHEVQLTPQQYEKGHYYCCNQHAQLDSKTKEKVSKAFAKYEGGHPLRDSKIRKKIDETNLERYGTTMPVNTPEWQRQIKENCKIEYGVEHPMARPDIQKKRKESYRQSCLNKYGVENTSQIPEVKRKISSSKRNYYWPIMEKTANNQNLEILSSFDDYIERGHFKYKCTKCGLIFETDSCPSHTLCPNCKQSFVSNKEREVAEWICSIYDGSVETSNRSAINPYELDIYIPEKKLAIEFDGMYWHSDKFKETDYHQKKTKLCIKNDIRLIHIPEWIWNTKCDIIKSIIENALGIYEISIYARETSCKEITPIEYRNFLIENHIQGAIDSKYKFGLFYNNELVAVLGYGHSRFAENETELHRFCVKRGYRIIGGFSKLIKHSRFKGVSYIDLNYFNGTGYILNGFKPIRFTEPSYIWINSSNGIMYSRYQTQKHKLEKLLENYDPDLSETQNMELNGFAKIYDSGTLKVELQ